MPSSTNAPAVNADLSLNEVVARVPGALGPLNALGLDLCCGGASSLREAAADAGLPVQALLDAIAGVQDGGEAGR